MLAKRIFQKRSILVLGAVLGIVFGLGIWSKSGSPTLTNEQLHWSTRIDQIGATRAYQEFKTVYQNRNFHEQHIGSHILGELIYRKQGLEGVATCDESFGFGCYHTFFLQAVIEHGLGVSARLSQVCIDKFGDQAIGCLPGIGHGLIEYLGPQKLKEALVQCSLTSEINHLLGCPTGVFTGYNFPAMTEAAGYSSHPRAYLADQSYAPCTEVASSFRPSCYMGLPQWWNIALGRDYSKMGTLCQSAPEPYRDVCFLGIGRVASPTAEFRVPGVLSRCQKMPGSYELAVCLGGAAGVFQSVANRPEEAKLICAGLDEAGRTICTTKSKLLIGRGGS